MGRKTVMMVEVLENTSFLKALESVPESTCIWFSFSEYLDLLKAAVFFLCNW